MNRTFRIMTGLFSGAALMNAAMAVASAVSTIVAGDRLGARWGAVPNTAGIVGTGIGALALTVLMNRRGRKVGLTCGYLVSACGGTLAALAVAAGDVIALSGGMLLLGLGNAGAQLSRYAAAGLYPPERRGFAISTVVWAGAIGAVGGPLLLSPSDHVATMFGWSSLTGPYALAALATLGAAAALATTRSAPADAEGGARSGSGCGGSGCGRLGVGTGSGRLGAGGAGCGGSGSGPLGAGMVGPGSGRLGAASGGGGSGPLGAGVVGVGSGSGSGSAGCGGSGCGRSGAGVVVAGSGRSGSAGAGLDGSGSGPLGAGEVGGGSGRLRLREVVRTPGARTALAVMATAQVVMVAVMTAAPLDMHMHGQGLGAVGMALSAHTLGMFALSPVTGWLLDRVGARPVMIGGLVTLAAATILAATTPQGDSSSRTGALFLLGYGWNLCFVGGSGRLAGDLPASARANVEGAVDAAVWSIAAVASLASTLLLSAGGYAALAWTACALLAFPAALLLRAEAAASGGPGPSDGAGHPDRALWW